METPKTRTVILPGEPPRLDPERILYPERDGKPVGETDLHISAIFYLRHALRQVFRSADSTYVAANMLFYYEEGVPASVTCPDVFVVKGVAKHDRRTFKVWEERTAPSVIFEITSRSSRLEDQGTKRGLYEMLGVREYFLFDPLDEYLRPRFQGYKLVEGSYERIPESPDGTLRSEELDLILRPEGPLLRVVDPRTGEAEPTAEEALDLASAEAERARAEAERARDAGERAEREAMRAAALEAEVARLRALLGNPPRPG